MPRQQGGKKKTEQQQQQPRQLQPNPQPRESGSRRQRNDLPEKEEPQQQQQHDSFVVANAGASASSTVGYDSACIFRAQPVLTKRRAAEWADKVRRTATAVSVSDTADAKRLLSRSVNSASDTSGIARLQAELRARSLTQYGNGTNGVRVLAGSLKHCTISWCAAFEASLVGPLVRAGAATPEQFTASAASVGQLSSAQNAAATFATTPAFVIVALRQGAVTAKQLRDSQQQQQQRSSTGTSKKQQAQSQSDNSIAITAGEFYVAGVLTAQQPICDLEFEDGDGAGVGTEIACFYSFGRRPEWLKYGVGGNKKAADGDADNKSGPRSTDLPLAALCTGDEQQEQQASGVAVQDNNNNDGDDDGDANNKKSTNTTATTKNNSSLRGPTEAQKEQIKANRRALAGRLINSALEFDYGHPANVGLQLQSDLLMPQNDLEWMSIRKVHQQLIRSKKKQQQEEQAGTTTTTTTKPPLTSNRVSDSDFMSGLDSDIEFLGGVRNNNKATAGELLMNADRGSSDDDDDDDDDAPQLELANLPGTNRQS